MLPPHVQEWIHRLRASGAFEFQWGGASPLSRLAAVMIVAVIVLGAVAIFAPQATGALLVVAGLVVFFLAGTWIMGLVSPQSMLDPPNYVKWFNAAQAAKGLPAPEPEQTQVIESTEYQGIDASQEDADA